MQYRLQDLIDIGQFQELQDKLNAIYSFPSAIIDNDGNILTATAWQDICTQFHRQNPECLEECLKSDRYILSHIAEANPAVSYRCPHGLVDNATPIIIDGVYLGTFFTGQFFLEEPDQAFFRDQARKHGFDEAAYLEALAKVPVWTQEKLDSYLFFIKGLIEVISGIGLKNLRAMEARLAIEESEKRFHVMFEMASIGIAQADPHTGKWIRVNQKLCEITGYTAEEMLALHVPDITHPEDRGMDWEAFQRVVRGEVPNYRIEKRYIRKDGTVIWVNVNMTVIRDAGGQPTRTMATIEDITERRRMDAVLRESESRFRTIFESSPIAIWEEDFSELKTRFDELRRAGISDFRRYFEENPGEVAALASRVRILETNQRSVELLGADSPANLLRELPRYFTADSLRVFKEEMITLAEGARTFQAEIPVLNQKGENLLLDLNLSVPPEHAGNLNRVLVSFMDITERKRTEETLRTSEERFRRTFQHSAAGMVLTSPDFRFIKVNNAFCNMLGYTESELLEKTFQEVTLPEDRAVGGDLVHRVLYREMEAFHLEKRYLHKNGTVVWGLVSATLICDAQNEPLYLVAQIQDISERKRTEEELRASEERHRVILQTAMEGFWIIGPDARLLEVNDAYCRMSGYTEQELLSMRIPDLEAEETKNDTALHIQKIIEQGEDRFESRHRRKDGSVYDIQSTVKYRPEQGGRMVAFIRDITEEKRREDLMQVRLRLLEQALSHHPLGDLLRTTLDEAEALTGSQVGFYHFVDPDQVNLSLQAWSTNTTRHMCTAAGAGLHYPVNEAGVWVDCLLQRKPVIHNDYAALTHRKGLPEGHAPVIRELVVPVFRGDAIVAVLGVGNKAADYDARDVEIVEALADLAWDIAERKRAEEALQQANDRLSLAQRSAGAGMWDWDMTSNRLTWSPELFVIFGLKPDLLPTLDLWQKVIYPEDWPQAEARLNDAIQLRLPLVNEYRIVLPTGELRWIYALGDTTYDAQGNPTRMSGICIDITERKRSEEALRESENNLTAMINASPESAFLCDPEGVVIMANPIFAQRIGLSSEEVIGRPVYDFLPLDLAESRRVKMAQVIQTGELLTFEDIRNGRHFTHYLHPVFNVRGKVSRIAVFGHDITDYRKAEEHLRDQNDLLASIRHAQNSFIAGNDPQLVYTEMLQVLVRTTGSTFGFLDEVVYDPGGTPHKSNLALSQCSWDGESKRRYEQLSDTSLVEGQVVIANDIRRDSRYEGAPENPARLENYLGVPLYLGNEIIGVAGIANRPGGYTEEVAEFIQPLTQACAVMIWAGRAMHRDEENLAALKNSEERYRRIVETANEGVWGMDREHRTTFVNQHMAEMLGRKPGDIIGRPVEEFMFSEDLPAHRERMARRHNKQGDVYQHRFRRPDGSEVWTFVSATAVLDEQGEFNGSFAMFTDITAHKQAEEALRLQSMVLDQIQDHVVVTDLQGTITYVNDAECRSFQHTREQLLGQSIESFGDDPSRGASQHEIIEETLAHGEWRGEVVNFTPDKQELYLDCRTRVVRNDQGTPVAMCEISTDITERKRAEDALRESEHRFRSYFELPLVGIAMTSPEKGWMEVNDRLCEILGYPREELTQMTWFQITHPEDLAADQEQFSRVQSGQMDAYSLEKRFIRKDGQMVYTDLSVRCVRKKSGEIDYFVALIQDITGRKALETQLQQAQKMDSVGRLAGGVAHDFNNMLSVILGHVEVALDQVDKAHPVHADLEEIAKAAERSAGLTRQLLAFARKQTVTPKVLDLNETVLGMLKMLQRLIGESIRLNWRPSETLWAVHMDPSQLDQILANLCVNARDAITDIGQLTIETRNASFNEEYCTHHQGFMPGEYVRLAVSDNGRGMEEEMLAHIFEPFFTTKGVGEGTGLGLATVYGIVQQNNGFISVRSEPGMGTAFEVFFPRYKDRAEQVRGQGTAKPNPRGHETILLAEDEPSILKLTKMLLEKQGYTVLDASTPGQAIRLAREHEGEIHLLITDVVMPEMNGRDLAKNVLSLYPGIKRLFMSGYTADVIAHHGVLEEGVFFIQKPFSKTNLAAKVREVLDTE